MLGQTIDKHTDDYFEAIEAKEALVKRLLCKDKFLAPRALFVQAKDYGPNE